MTLRVNLHHSDGNEKPQVPGGSVVKNLHAMQKTPISVFSHFCIQPTPVFLPGEFHGQRSLAGYSA